MNVPELIADEGTSSQLRKQCGEIIDTKERLPNFVFRKQFKRYYAVEYAHVCRQTFGTLLREMSDIFHDDSANYLMVDPRPWKNTGFGLIAFTPANLPSRYFEVMAPTRGLTDILVGANVGVFWGSSGRWSIFADRISWELAIIATDGDVDVSAVLGWPCFSTEQVRSYITGQYHAKDPSDQIANEFYKGFSENYSL
jgi:hypothetical protein